MSATTPPSPAIEAITDTSLIDAEILRPWLTEYLADHLRWWSAAAGRMWSTPEIEAHLARHELVERDLAEMREACGAPDQYVGILRDPSLIGIVYAAQRRCRYLHVPVGMVSWVGVAPDRRGAGLGRALIASARAWMDAQGCALQEVFVTAPNVAAVETYRRAGFDVVDHRMLAAGVVDAKKR